MDLILRKFANEKHIYILNKWKLPAVLILIAVSDFYIKWWLSNGLAKAKNYYSRQHTHAAFELKLWQTYEGVFWLVSPPCWNPEKNQLVK